MTSVEQIAELFAELGPQAPEIVSVSQDGQADAWAVELDDGMIVEAALDGERGVLSFSSNLGRPNDDVRTDVYQSLLLYNSLRDRTGGVTMSLAEPSGDVVQSYDLDLRDLTAVTLHNLVLNLAAKARLWQNVVASGAPIDVPSGEGMTGGIEPLTAIRV